MKEIRICPMDSDRVVLEAIMEGVNGIIRAKNEESAPSASTNRPMLEIALCLKRLFTIVNQGSMGKYCDLESDINAVIARLQQ